MINFADSLFSRVTTHKGAPVLQVARAFYHRPLHHGRVILQSVVHIGSKVFYANLQNALEKLDVVLCEGISEKSYKLKDKFKLEPVQTFESSDKFPEVFDRPVAKKYFANPGIISAYSLNSVELIQNGMAKIAGLITQYQGLDYAKFNACHADISKEANPREFSQLQNMFKTLLENKKLGASVKDQKKIEKILENFGQDFFGGLRPSRKKTLKFILASMAVMEIVFDKKMQNILVGTRNKITIDKLNEFLRNKCYNEADIGILYGVMHMEDFHRRLVKDGWKLKYRVWERVW